MQRKFSTRAAAMLAIVGVVIAFSSGCGKVSDKVGEKVAEKSIERATGAEVDASDDGVSIKTKDGEYSSKTTKKAPKDWPSDILPVADGFEIKSVTETKVADGATSIMATSGKGDPMDMVDFYVDAFESNGVEVSMQTKSGDSGMVSGEKGNVRFQVIIGTEGDEVTALLSTTATSTTE